MSVCVNVFLLRVFFFNKTFLGGYLAENVYKHFTILHIDFIKKENSLL